MFGGKSLASYICTPLAKQIKSAALKISELLYREVEQR